MDFFFRVIFVLTPMLFGNLNAWAGPSHITILTTSPILNTYSASDGWILRMDKAQIQTDGTMVEFGPKADIINSVTAEPLGPEFFDFDREFLFIYLPAEILNPAAFPALFVQSGAQKYALRISGEPTRTNIESIRQNLALVGQVPMGTFRVNPEYHIPYYRFDGPVQADLVEYVPGAPAAELSAIDPDSLPRQDLHFDPPPQVQTDSGIDPITFFTPLPQIVSIENNRLIMETISSEITWPGKPALEVTPRSFLTDSDGMLFGQIGKVRISIPATTVNIEAAIKVLMQPEHSVVDRRLAMVMKGAADTNITSVGRMLDGYGSPRTAMAVEDPTAVPEIRFDDSTHVEIVRYVHADAVANDSSTPVPVGSPTRNDICQAFLRAQKREPGAFLRVISSPPPTAKD